MQQRNERFGSLVVTFPTRAIADEAIRELHQAGVRHTWLGVAKMTEPEASEEPQSARHERVDDLALSHAVRRWFHRDRDETLYDALREHGVGEEDARRIDGGVAEGNCVLVAEDVRAPIRAAAIAARHGGTMLVTLGAGSPPPGESDPLAESRVEAAHRHPVSGELDINDVRRESQRLREVNVPTVREEIYVRRSPVR